MGMEGMPETSENAAEKDKRPMAELNAELQDLKSQMDKIQEEVNSNKKMLANIEAGRGGAIGVARGRTTPENLTQWIAEDEAKIGELAKKYDPVYNEYVDRVNQGEKV